MIAKYGTHDVPGRRLLYAPFMSNHMYIKGCYVDIHNENKQVYLALNFEDALETCRS